jgi:hypothetical protein
MKRIFSRGLNFHGQCGLGQDMYYSLEKFTELRMNLPIKRIVSNVGHTLALDENQKTVYFWGFNWDLRSFFRTAAAYNFLPRFLQFLKVRGKFKN